MNKTMNKMKTQGKVINQENEQNKENNHQNNVKSKKCRKDKIIFIIIENKERS